MTADRKLAATLVSALLVFGAAPAAAQDEPSAAPMESPAAAPMEEAAQTVEVSGKDYLFEGLPTSLPVGSVITFRNDGSEYHEIVIVKINDETTPLEELMAMPEEETSAISEFVGYLATFPATTADGSITVAAPGRYVAICNIRQGSDPTAFEALGFDPSELETADPSTLPPEVQELLATIESNPPHLELGMIAEFTVTA